MFIGKIHELVQYNNISKQTVFIDPRFQVLLLSLAKDAYLKPHQSKTDAFFLVTEGEVIFTVGGEDHHLFAGDLFTFSAREQHAVKAVQNATLMIVK